MNPEEIRSLVKQSAVEWHWQETEKATGKCGAADDAIAIDLQHGYISRWREYIDTQICMKPALQL